MKNYHWNCEIAWCDGRGAYFVRLFNGIYLHNK